jgi:hypothetical protein
MSLERERLLERAATHAGAASRDDRRRHIARLIATASCVGVATYALVRASGMTFAPSLGNTHRGRDKGNARVDATSIDATERTVREYKDELFVLSWSHDRGFKTHRRRWRAEAPGARRRGDDANEDANEVSNRNEGAGALMARTIEKYMPDRLSATSAPFELLYSTRDMPSTPA